MISIATLVGRCRSPGSRYTPPVPPQRGGSPPNSAQIKKRSSTPTAGSYLYAISPTLHSECRTAVTSKTRPSHGYLQQATTVHLLTRLELCEFGISWARIKFLRESTRLFLERSTISNGTARVSASSPLVMGKKNSDMHSCSTVVPRPGRSSATRRCRPIPGPFMHVLIESAITSFAGR
jgi:hypothetical protein